MKRITIIGTYSQFIKAGSPKAKLHEATTGQILEETDRSAYNAEIHSNGHASQRIVKTLLQQPC